MNLVALAQAALAVAGIVEPGLAPAITTANQLGKLLKSVGNDLANAPVDSRTGLPMTLADAEARLKLAHAKSDQQDNTIRANALAALAENAAE